MALAMQLNRPKSDVYSIADIVELAESGRLQIPDFQRSFVWDERDIRNLFDSIWRGFPVGTLLMWNRKSEPTTVRFGDYSVDVPGDLEVLTVVDGQQRITTLVASLSAEAPGVDRRFDLCFDLRRNRFVHPGKKHRPAWWLPLRVVLESRTLLSWMREQGEDLNGEELDKADAVAGSIRDFKIPAYIVESDDEALLRDVFDRVNTSGKPISRAQTFHALFGGREEVGSAASVIEDLTRLGFGTIDDQRVVQSLLALRGGDVQRDLRDEFDRAEDRLHWFDDTRIALGRSIDFLRTIGVPHLQLMPTTLPLPILAAFFHLHPDPEPWTLRLLARWMWRGWALGFGRSGQTPALRQATRVVNPTKGAPADAPGEYEAVSALLKFVPDDRPEDFTTQEFRSDHANGRLALLALAQLTPLDRSGSPIDISSAIEQHGSAAVASLVSGSRRSNLASRGFWPLDASPPTGSESPDVLRSHAVVDRAAECLRDGDADGFLEARAGTLSALVRDFLEVRLEAGAPVRPPLSQLVVADDE